MIFAAALSAVKLIQGPATAAEASVDETTLVSRSVTNQPKYV
jgi:hypothetical protein